MVTATSPYARYTKAFGGNLEPVHASSDLLVIGVNTTRAWRHKNGEVSSVQIERVAKLLNAASPQQLRLVVVHQPAAVAQAEERVNLLRGHEAALHAWSAAGLTSSWVGTYICPTRWRCMACPDDFQCFRLVPPFRRVLAPKRPTR